MKQNYGYNKDFADKTNPPNEKEIKEKEEWLNEHGQPDFEYLQSLAADGSEEALEKLKSIAEDLDVDYDPNASTEELIETIRSAVADNEDGGSTATT